IWVGCILVAWAWRATMVHFFGHYAPARLFMHVMQLPGTLDEFGAGIFFAKFMDERTTPRLREGVGWTLAAVAAGPVWFPGLWAPSSYGDEPLMIIFWRTSLGVFFFCVVAAAVMLPTVARTWPLRPIRYLGEVSYGIYLWHLFAIAICVQ